MGTTKDDSPHTALSTYSSNQDNIMEIKGNTEPCPSNVREVHIVSGITPDDVEIVLNMAAASGVFSSDVMMTAEDMAWDSAYGDGNELHTFLKATVNESGAEKIIGFICYGPIRHWPGNHELYGITVDSKYRRLGIGSALMAEMQRQIVVNDGKHIFLETGTDRMFENARLFYEANDFVHEYRFYKQFIPTEGGVIYRLGIDAGTTDEHYQ